MSLADLKVVKVRVGPAHRRLNMLVKLVQSAVSRLNSPPDRGLEVLKRNLELVESYP